MRPTVALMAATCALACALPAAAQDEAALRAFFEGKRVTVKLEMPGTSEGIDVQADSKTPIDYRRYGDRLKQYGTAIRSGESAVVTLVKVKKDLIEFQLGGGGYGTFGDDTSTSVYMPHVEKSSRERDLEKRIEDEKDGQKVREMQREIDDLRARRERQNRRIDAERERAEAVKREQLAERRLHGGSRFNIRYDDEVPRGIRPEEVMAALAEYVDFSSIAPQPRPTATAPATPPETPTLPIPLHKGMTRGEVVETFGRPAETSDRREGGMTITSLVFVNGDQRITAEFVEDVLVRYTVASK